MKKFNQLYLTLLKEAEEDDMTPPDVGGEEGGLPEEMDMDAMADNLDAEPEEPVNPEEIELAKVAIRAIYFNLNSKDVHQYKLKVGDTLIPFEKIPDYFEETKQWKPVLAFIEHVMDKFEGISSKWAEEKEISGKPIIQKIKIMNKNIPEDQQLDNARRLYWVRIILNCILSGKPTENMNIGDVTERNLPEIFAMLKLHYGADTRGIVGHEESQSPGVF